MWLRFIVLIFVILKDIFSKSKLYLSSFYISFDFANIDQFVNILSICEKFQCLLNIPRLKIIQIKNRKGLCVALALQQANSDMILGYTRHTRTVIILQHRFSPHFTQFFNTPGIRQSLNSPKSSEGHNICICSITEYNVLNKNVPFRIVTF